MHLFVHSLSTDSILRVWLLWQPMLLKLFPRGYTARRSGREPGCSGRRASSSSPTSPVGPEWPRPPTQTKQQRPETLGEVPTNHRFSLKSYFSILKFHMNCAFYSHKMSILGLIITFYPTPRFQAKLMFPKDAAYIPWFSVLPGASPYLQTCTCGPV